MLKITKHGPILLPSDQGFEQKGVLNPAVYREGEFVHVFYRAINENFHSSIGYAKLEGPLKVVERYKEPVIKREFDYERAGVEDARLTKIDNTFYLLYCAHNGQSATTAYATSKDLKKFRKHGIISSRIPYRIGAKLLKKSKLKDSYYFFSAYTQEQEGKDVLIWSKDMVLFPEKIKGKFAMLTRILPDMQIMFFRHFKELNDKFWKKYLSTLSESVVLENKHWFETRGIGPGCPPIRTPDGWLLIFHTIEETNRGRVYRACAALLDKKDPLKVVARLHEPLFSPEEKWEKEGMVPNVVFPTGTALFGPDLYIYYGAADTRIAVASMKLSDLLVEIKNSKHKN